MGETDSNRRSLKNLPLTRKYHWNYIGWWVTFNCLLVVGTEVLTMLLLLSDGADVLPYAPEFLIPLSGILTILVMCGLVFLGAVSAHRIAGVHIKLTRVLEAVADGDQSAQLKFRSEDRLAKVEAAFERMMESLRANPAGVTEEDQQGAPNLGQEKRTWNSINLTREHHRVYMGVWILLTLSMEVLLYLCAVCCIYAYFGGMEAPSGHLLIGSTAVVMTLAFFTAIGGVKTAHRLAGVHVQLERVFNQVGEGRRDVRLRFRASDDLGQVENAFSRMMESVATSEDGEQLLADEEDSDD